MVHKREKSGWSRSRRGRSCHAHIVKANEVIRASDLCCLWLLGPPLACFWRELLHFSYHILEGDTLLSLKQVEVFPSSTSWPLYALTWKLEHIVLPFRSLSTVTRLIYEGYWCWHQKKKIEGCVKKYLWINACLSCKSCLLFAFVFLFVLVCLRIRLCVPYFVFVRWLCCLWKTGLLKDTADSF